MRNLIIQRLKESAVLKIKLIDSQSPIVEQIEQLATRIIETYRKKGKIVLFGNGGSAADAQHIACELVGRFKTERVALPAIALTTDTSILTALSNDYSFEDVFSRQISAIVDPDDVVIGISTSGNSSNVINGIKKAKELGAFTVGLTGGTGGRLTEFADLCIIIPSSDTPRIQEVHITIGHILCELIEKELFQDRKITEHEDKKTHNLKIKELNELTKVVSNFKARGLKIVFTNGCFDILHLGHVRLLKEAKKLGDKLIVAINSDSSVKQIKGENRPVFSEKARAEMLAALECVDFVTVFDEPTPINLIKTLRPDVLVKGGDYTLDEIVGKEEVLAYGGQVLTIPLVEGYSTTQIISSISKIKNDLGINKF